MPGLKSFLYARQGGWILLLPTSFGIPPQCSERLSYAPTCNPFVIPSNNGRDVRGDLQLAPVAVGCAGCFCLYAILERYKDAGRHRTDNAAAPSQQSLYPRLVDGLSLALAECLRGQNSLRSLPLITPIPLKYFGRSPSHKGFYRVHG